MRLLYRNFDGLDVSFKGAMPSEVVRALAIGKMKAQEQREDALVLLGPKRIPVYVSETGMKGGYAFRFDTGPFGAIWAVADNTDRERWNIRASMKSLALADGGYRGAKAQLVDTLADLGAMGPNGIQPEERISRVDFCTDFALPSFQPDPEHIVCHSHTTRRVHRNWLGETVNRGNRIESLTIGKMPGRQVVLYDKTREILVHEKPYWWDYWKLDSTRFEGEVWRVEVRAGKAELDNWNLRSFGNLERIGGAVIESTLNAIRYTDPTNDTQASRWPAHPLWSACLAAAEDAFAPYDSTVKRGKVIEGLRADIVKRFAGLFPGLLASYTHHLGHDISELPAVLESLEKDILDFASENPRAMESKFRRAAERYALLR